ncbi:MAG: RNA polymerase factor sigma-32 [Alphaproteobacteria bacterium]
MAYVDTPQTQKANRRYINRSMKAALLTREREFELANRWRENQDEDALHELVNAYGRLVIKLASRFKNYGLPMSDLVQEGNIGLLQAAARFETEREVRFSTYAAWWIRSAMQDFVLRNWSIVRTGTTAAQKSLFFNLRRMRAKHADEVDGWLSGNAKDKIADELRVRITDIEDMEMRLSGSDQSLNAAVSEASEDEWQDFMSDDRPTPEEEIQGSHDGRTRSKWLASALEELTDRERTIIHERRLRDDSVTLEELGKKLGISKERVRQIEHKALQKLRASVTRQNNDATAVPAA